MIELKLVIFEDAPFLYRLLRERDQVANISHKRMPPYGMHEGFVRTWPSQYEAWYTICEDGVYIGSIYITWRGEIGLFLLKGNQGKGYGVVALGMLKKKHPKARYLANIAPKNEGSARFFEREGFKMIQRTYELGAA